MQRRACCTINPFYILQLSKWIIRNTKTLNIFQIYPSYWFYCCNLIPIYIYFIWYLVLLFQGGVCLDKWGIRLRLVCFGWGWEFLKWGMCLIGGNSCQKIYFHVNPKSKSSELAFSKSILNMTIYSRKLRISLNCLILHCVEI